MASYGSCAAGCGRRSLAQLTNHSCDQCASVYEYCPDCAELHAREEKE